MDSHALDLTFLTETERKWIANVLNRDEALQKKEDERIARLKNKAARTNNSTIKKKIKLRSGEWFYDLVQPNKKSIKSGRETVRASIRVKSKDGQHRRPPLPPPDVLPQPDIIIEEQDITQNNDSYNDRTSAYRISGYIDEEEENYSSDQNKGSTFANMHHAYVQEMPQSNDDYINDKPAETDLSTENDKHKDVVIPENYEYLQLTADEPEEDTPEPVLKRAGSIRRKSTKRDKTQDAPPEIVFSSYDSTPDIQAEVENEQPQTDESNPFALIDDKESIETSSQQTSIISSDVVSDITDKHDDYVDDILEQSKDAHDISTDYSVSEPEVVNDVTVDDVIAEVATPIIEDEIKTELEDKVDELAGAMDFLQSMEDVREPKPGATNVGAYEDILACLSCERVAPGCMLDGHNTNLQLDTVSSGEGVVNEIVSLLANNQEKKAALYRAGEEDEILSMLQVDKSDSPVANTNLSGLNLKQNNSLHDVVHFLANSTEDGADLVTHADENDNVNCLWPQAEVDPEIIASIVARETKMTSGTDSY